MSQENATISENSVWFWRTIGPDVERMFTPEQKDAINSAVEKSAADALPTDIRFTIGGYFFRVIAGKERRNPERLKEEAEKYPVLTKNNMPMLLAIWVGIMCTLFYMLEFGIYALTGISFNGGF